MTSTFPDATRPSFSARRMDAGWDSMSMIFPMHRYMALAVDPPLLRVDIEDRERVWGREQGYVRLTSFVIGKYLGGSEEQYACSPWECARTWPSPSPVPAPSRLDGGCRAPTDISSRRRPRRPPWEIPAPAVRGTTVIASAAPFPLSVAAPVPQELSAIPRGTSVAGIGANDPAMTTTKREARSEERREKIQRPDERLRRRFPEPKWKDRTAKAGADRPPP